MGWVLWEQLVESALRLSVTKCGARCLLDRVRLGEMSIVHSPFLLLRASGTSLRLDKLGVVSEALREPQGREPVESVEPRSTGLPALALLGIADCRSQICNLESRRACPRLSTSHPSDRALAAVYLWCCAQQAPKKTDDSRGIIKS